MYRQDIHFRASQPVSATTPDWGREAKAFFGWSPSRSLLASIRAYQRHADSNRPWHRLDRKIAVVRHRFWSIVTGADIPLNSAIGGGLLLPHPNGVVIHPGASIGPNCLIFQQVTIGAGKKPGLPVIGGHVDIGAGARILGGVTIGDHACIGANAVVLQDVPAGKTAVGIPAMVIDSSPGPVQQSGSATVIPIPTSGAASTAEGSKILPG